MSFKIAIIGRPNVGKSTLFNRLVGEKLALVDPTPGLTRDRKQAKASLGDINFTMIDTAGLEKAESETIEELMMVQTEVAISEADIIFMMIDSRDGITPIDEHFIQIVRRKNIPTIPIANKCEGKKGVANLPEAWKMGFGEPVAISAEHGLGISELYDALVAKMKEIGIEQSDDDDIIEDGLTSEILQIAIIGRPNAGKSTLFNNLVREERSIVSPVAGTTRDSVYIDWEYKGNHIKLVDTAGMRKKAKTHERTEKMSVMDGMKAIQYANVVVLLIDATQALDKQDLTLADYCLKEGRGLVIAINKWDLIKEKDALLDELKYRLATSLSQARGIPIVTLSASRGKNTLRVIETALEIFKIWNKRISTGKLNRWLDYAVSKHIPPLSKGKRIKFKYILQSKGRPPTFLLFSTSNLKELPDSYLKYLVNGLRDEFGFDGVPIRINIRKGDNPYDKK